MITKEAKDRRDVYFLDAVVQHIEKKAEGANPALKSRLDMDAPLNEKERAFVSKHMKHGPTMKPGSTFLDVQKKLDAEKFTAVKEPKIDQAKAKAAVKKAAPAKKQVAMGKTSQEKRDSYLVANINALMQKKAEENTEAARAGYISGYLCKEAGAVSEYVGKEYNPFNLLGNPIGTVTAGLTKTRTPKEQREAEKADVSNVLVPGKAAYNWFKRLGTVNTELNREGAPGAYGTTVLETVGQTPALSALGTISPAAAMGVFGASNLAAGLLALSTKTRTKKEQLDYEKSTKDKLMNLIPGVGTYNMFKRIGHAAERYDKDRIL